ncbi:MAG TPA: DUF3300 domain-containing protein [Terriglobales bacterium]|nr:DUF3300 domain-containing protein [Terriglobales bacterium]
MAPTIRRVLALLLALLLLPLGQQELFAQQGPPPGDSQNDSYNQQYSPDQQSGYGQQQPDPVSGQQYLQEGNGQAQPPAEPLNAGQLEQLVAPIALYPDTLVAQVLAASTYPTQVADAAHWRLAQGYASPDQIAAGADAQNWDPSVKALAAFPQVLAQMDRNLGWTTALGNAYYNQPQDVLQAVQMMRRRAQAAGNLQSTPQEAVSYDQGYIELAPVNPQLVYVPVYNPWSVYGQPVSPYPGFSLLGALGSFFGSAFGSPFGSSFGSSAISYGLGIAMSAFSHTPWGWLAWGLNWLTQSVLFNHSNYYSSSTTVANWGFQHGGGWGRPASTIGQGFVPRPPISYRRPGNGHGPALGQGFVPRPPSSYSRPGSGRNPTVVQGFVPRPPRSYGRPQSGYNATRGAGFVPRPPVRYAENRPIEGFGRSAYSGTRGDYARSSAYRSPQRAYRVPTNAFQHSSYKPRSYKPPKGDGFSRSYGKPPKGFGGGHAPKGFSGGKSFGGKHSGGGGHSSGHGGGHHH